MNGPYHLPFPCLTDCPDKSCPAASWGNFQLLLYSKCTQPSVMSYVSLVRSSKLNWLHAHSLHVHNQWESTFCIFLSNLSLIYTVIRFVSTTVILNLVIASGHLLKLNSTFKSSIYTHDGAGAKFITREDETDYSVRGRHWSAQIDDISFWPPEPLSKAKSKQIERSRWTLKHCKFCNLKVPQTFKYSFYSPLKTGRWGSAAFFCKRSMEVKFLYK